MRPAQKAPENTKKFLKGKLSKKRFNEAGAKSAGKLRGRLRRISRRGGCFNEAGAKSAGKPASPPIRRKSPDSLQ